MPLIQITYSPSNRSCCRNCYEKIAENTIRIGYYVKKGGGYTNIQWYHEKCFTKANLWGVTDIELTGLEELSGQDRLRIKEKFEAIQSKKNPVKF
ncbi:unnamed protein product [Paramecium primaurelia]|uniref:PARP-type domain-containing protein n=2 Tax=Paramecium TaxID=5884 RepID=A0A8S1UZ23_9CILI|nr:unnamed protein product [Paramecium primaurelia]CAD8169413.1 unnamed protein product [Paramecium pentaurelia]